MRIFDTNGKVNFVDEDDVLVGFDVSELCCEHWGFFFACRIPDKIESIPREQNRPKNPDELRFDPDYYKEFTCGALFDEGAAAVFRLVGPNNRQVFLVLYNCHNGYYSHGFTVTVGGKVIRNGKI